MKVKLLIFFLVFVFQVGFSQTEKLIQAKVLCEDFPLQGVEVLNLATKKTTITDSNGRFSILAKAKDTLMLISKNYEYKRFILDPKLIEKNNFVISLLRKTEELDEVVIFKMPNIKLSKDKAYEQGKINELVLEKAARNPKPIGVYDGTLVNSPDLMRIGGMILGLFKKEKDIPKKVISKIEFKKIATSTCNQDFFSKTLKLKPEEVALFLEFCDADPKSKIGLENANALSLMDFLFVKIAEFKKLPAFKK